MARSRRRPAAPLAGLKPDAERRHARGGQQVDVRQHDVERHAGGLGRDHAHRPRTSSTPRGRVEARRSPRDVRRVRGGRADELLLEQSIEQLERIACTPSRGWDRAPARRAGAVRRLAHGRKVAPLAIDVGAIESSASTTSRRGRARRAAGRRRVPGARCHRRRSGRTGSGAGGWSDRSSVGSFEHVVDGVGDGRSVSARLQAEISAQQLPRVDIGGGVERVARAAAGGGLGGQAVAEHRLQPAGVRRGRRPGARRGHRVGPTRPPTGSWRRRTARTRRRGLARRPSTSPGRLRCGAVGLGSQLVGDGEGDALFGPEVVQHRLVRDLRRGGDRGEGHVLVWRVEEEGFAVRAIRCLVAAALPARAVIV